MNNHHREVGTHDDILAPESADWQAWLTFIDRAISLGAILIFWLFFVQCIASLVLWLNGSIVGWSALATATTLSIFTVALLGHPQPGRGLAPLVAGSLVLLSGAIGVSSMLHDFSVDGQSYHQQAVIELTRGWNPFFGFPVEGAQALWVNSYAKGAWLISATISFASNSIEAGKATSLIYGLSAFLLALPAVALVVRRNHIWVLCLAAAAALNPVLGCQWPTYYLDSQMGSLFLVITAVIVLAVGKAISWRLATAIIGASLVMLVNIKFTGLVFACVVIPLLALGAAHYSGRAFVIRTILGGGVAIAFGILFIGWNPYVTNLIQQGNPFYPLVGPGRVDIMVGNADQEFLEKDRVSKLLLSTFARSHSLVADDQLGKQKQIELKIPLSTSASELRFFATRQDTRIAGFGPLFGGCLLLAIFIFSQVLWRAESKREILIIGAVSLALLATVLAIPEPWWARYVPQFWLLPAILILSGFQYGKNRLLLGISKLATGLLLLNCAMVWGAALGGAALSEISLRKQLAHLSLLSSQGATIDVQFSAESSKLRLMSNGISFREVEKLDCTSPMPLIRSMAMLCVDNLELRDTDYNPSFLTSRLSSG